MNILIFGPNGSGKGTQGAIVQKKFGVPHIETGVIFRQNIKGGTELGMKAKAFIDKGELVPDEITVPMILSRLQEDDCKKGWLLDGFPRNLAQAEALWKALQAAGMKLDFVIEISWTGRSPSSASWAGGSAPTTPTIPTPSTATPSSRRRRPASRWAGSAAARP
jgi:adenylate kinase family enzyme